MASSIDKELKKKKEKKIFYICFLVFGIYAFLTVLQTMALRMEDKRTPIEDLVTKGAYYVFLHPFNIFKVDGSSVMLAVLGAIVVILILIFYITERNLRKHDNVETVNGEAHLMTSDELKKYNIKFSAPLGKEENNGFNNMIISRDIRLAIDNKGTRRNCNILVIGGSGAGKSRFFAAPNILQYNTNFVITDPSGEMLNDYGKALEDNGYAVKVFNLTDVYRSNRYNPFHYIYEEKDVFILVNTLIKNTTPPDSHAGDPFWENSEKLLLTALILYIRHTYKPEERTFTNMLKLINLANIDENDTTKTESPLDILFEDLRKTDKENLAVKQYDKFKLGAGKTLKSILISVGVRLQTFDLADIKYLTMTDDFQFERFADTKQALFVIIPTADTTFNFLVSLLYSQLFSTLYKYAETNCEFGWAAELDKYTNLRVFQAKNKADTENAQKAANQFVNDVKRNVFVGYINDEGKFIKNKIHPEKKLFYVYTGADLKRFTEQVNKVKKQGYKDTKLAVYVQYHKPEPVGWRGTIDDTKEFLKKLKNITLKQCERRCPNHVRLILDEFANIGQIPDFDQKLATMRKYEISCSIILQALSQLKDIYKDKWNTIVANCDTKLFLGSDDSETIEWLLKMLGKKTTAVESMSFQVNGGGSTSINRSSLELMTIDQVSMMQDDECLVRIRGVRPYYGKKFELTLHPNYKYAHDTVGKFEIPLAKETTYIRERGFLYDRGEEEKENGHSGEQKPGVKDKEQSASSATEKEDKKNSVQKNDPKRVKADAQNKNRKEKAKSNSSQNEDYDEPCKPLEEILPDIIGAKEPTEEVIKETVESMVVLATPATGTYECLVTN